MVQAKKKTATKTAKKTVARKTTKRTCGYKSCTGAEKFHMCFSRI